jgi:hypothetical protein
MRRRKSQGQNRRRGRQKTITILPLFFFLFTIGVASSAGRPNDQDGSKNSKSELGPPPGTYRILSDNGDIAIPFEMSRGKIRIAARVNGHDCALTVDNGSLWNELLFFGSPHVDGLGLKKTGEMPLGPTKADLSSPVAVAFKDIEFLGQTAVITRYDPHAPNIWEGLDGQISATFFKHFVVKINFDASVIELIQPQAFEYRGEGQALPMKDGPFGSRTVACRC